MEQMGPSPRLQRLECVCRMSWGLARDLKLVDANAMRRRQFREEPTVCIVSHEADRFDRHGRIELADIDGEVAGGAAAPLNGRRHRNRHILLGPEGDGLVAVDHPATARNETASWGIANLLREVRQACLSRLRCQTSFSDGSLISRSFSRLSLGAIPALRRSSW